ncbi:MAG: peptide-methionine (S)-S-oxide reductase MsrA [Pseudomonadota bacterium]
MKLPQTALVAALAGGTATLAAFFMTAGADNDKAKPVTSAMETAIFAGGCFWCVESDFDKVDGVLETISGYTGGDTTSPTYKTHTKQGHLEAVKIVYDPTKVEYEELVSYFFRHIDPTDDGGQFCDRGNSYTTAVFVADAQERSIVEAEIANITDSGVLPGPIVTKVRDQAPFYDAENYHQDYYKKNPVRYKFYRDGCRRDARVKQVWGK